MSGSLIGVFLMVLICVADTLAQTFQYSHGWTSGKKRSGPIELPSTPHFNAERGDQYDLAHDPAGTLKRIAFEDGRQACKIILAMTDGQYRLRDKENFPGDNRRRK